MKKKVFASGESKLVESFGFSLQATSSRCWISSCRTKFRCPEKNVTKRAPFYVMKACRNDPERMIGSDMSMSDWHVFNFGRLSMIESRILTAVRGDIESIYLYNQRHSENRNLYAVLETCI